MAIIKPKIVVLLGAVAIKVILAKSLPIKKYHGTIEKLDNTIYFITFHPAAVLRFPKLKDILVKDFSKLSQLLKPSC